MPKNTAYIHWIKSISKDTDARLGKPVLELARLHESNFPALNAFVLCPDAFEQALKENDLKEPIEKLLKQIRFKDASSVEHISKQIQKKIKSMLMPQDVSIDIAKAYNFLAQDKLVQIQLSASKKNVPQSVIRSLDTAPLRIAGDANVIDLVLDAWAYFFNPECLHFRHKEKSTLFSSEISLLVLPEPEIDVSGLLYTKDPFSIHKHAMVIESVWGYYDQLLQGTVTPDRHLVDAHTFEIIHGETVPQHTYLNQSRKKVAVKKVPQTHKNQPKIEPHQIKKLVQLAKKIHQFNYFPQQIRWGIDGKKVYVFQSQRFHVNHPVATAKKETSVTVHNLEILLQGTPVSRGIVSGPVKIVKTKKDLEKIKPKDVIVSSSISPELMSKSHKAAAIITDFGGITSHGAVLAREMHIPGIVGTQSATRKLKNGQIVTVHGTLGTVYLGGMNKKQSPLTHVPKKLQSIQTKTATKVILSAQAQTNLAKVGNLPIDALLFNPELFPQKDLANQLKTVVQSMGNRTLLFALPPFKQSDIHRLRLLHKDTSHWKEDLKLIKKIKQQGYREVEVLLPQVSHRDNLALYKKKLASAGFRSGTTRMWIHVSTPDSALHLSPFLIQGIKGIIVDIEKLTRLSLGKESLTPLDRAELSPSIVHILKQALSSSKNYHAKFTVQINPEFLHQPVLDQLVHLGVTSVIAQENDLSSIRTLLYRAEHKKVHRPS